ncbi:hypothetical protein KW811_22035 [Enterobacter quasiroggenkampii]|uniref:VirB10/TraB/TrbI family type IV secretion system protein n=1 Tax=Enterobacter quasiroggenkampii TaxID=2497436 RepID=UPI0021D2815A|nr:VirB10/TraB/TrbI family type IV secretion system protein [Enterobacter quasiroggenkampii]MCU6401167.1 hypothetical protein [Enterobacter quasiroggenkampii]
MDENTEEFKSPAELEQEARARARADIDKDVTDDKPAAGQPVVVKHRKPKSKRTLLVCVFSLLALIGLATGGDYISGLLKKSNDETDESKQPTEKPSGGRERHDLGKDINALTFIDAKPSEAPDDADEAEPVKEDTLPPPPPPPAFNKATALAVDNDSGQPSTGGNKNSNRNATTGSTPATATATATTENAESGDNVVSVTAVRILNLDPNLFIPVDRYIPCSMMRRFVSDIAGNISCLISQDTYSANNHVKLIPAGTVARGKYRSGTLKNGQGRMFIAWTELRTPDHLIIPLVDTQATGQLGENGVAGWIDTHFWERFGNAMMLSVVDDTAAAIADNVPSTDGDTDYTQNTREAVADMAKVALENSINIPPTMYLNQGDVISIMTGSDIDFSGIYRLRLKNQ